MARFAREWEEKFTFRPRKGSWGVSLAMENVPLLAKVGDPRKRIKRLERQLWFFEEKYAMGSEAFYEKYRQGEIGAFEEFAVWAEIFTEYLYWKRRLK